MALGLSAEERIGLLLPQQPQSGRILSREDRDVLDRHLPRPSSPSLPPAPQPDLRREISKIASLLNIAATELASLPFDVAAVPGTVQRFQSRFMRGEIEPTLQSVMTNFGAAADETLRSIPGGEVIAKARKLGAAQAQREGVSTFSQ
jgi:hypothetical protein